jgi:hypothetical protein
VWFDDIGEAMSALQFGLFDAPKNVAPPRPKQPGPKSVAGKVLTLMLGDGAWRTLWEIQARTGGSQTAISARLRDFRKLGYKVDARQRVVYQDSDAAFSPPGVFEYRVRQ